MRLPASRCSLSQPSLNEPTFLLSTEQTGCLKLGSYRPSEAERGPKAWLPRPPGGPRCRKWASRPTAASLEQWYGPPLPPPPPRGGASQAFISGRCRSSRLFVLRAWRRVRRAARGSRAATGRPALVEGGRGEAEARLAEPGALLI